MFENDKRLLVAATTILVLSTPSAALATMFGADEDGPALPGEGRGHRFCFPGDTVVVAGFQ